jgi:CRISPR-associated protein Cas6
MPEMIDLVIDLHGDTLPHGHMFALWEALLGAVPELNDHSGIGVLPLRTSAEGSAVILAKRAKLAIRVPSCDAGKIAADLSGRQLDLAGTRLNLGASKERELKPFPTLHAQIVAGDDDEIRFMKDIQEEIEALGAVGKLICGKRAAISRDSTVIRGYSLVIHDLKPEASLTLQDRGLGNYRKFGCGIFIPYKVITGLRED